MKTQDSANPLEGKTMNPNYEPWLTWLELFWEMFALSNKSK